MSILYDESAVCDFLGVSELPSHEFTMTSSLTRFFRVFSHGFTTNSYRRKTLPRVKVLILPFVPLRRGLDVSSIKAAAFVTVLACMSMGWGVIQALCPVAKSIACRPKLG